MKDTYLELKQRFTKEEVEDAVAWMVANVLIEDSEKEFHEIIGTYGGFISRLYSFPKANPVETMHRVPDKCVQSWYMFQYVCSKLHADGTKMKPNLFYMDLICVWRDALVEGMKEAKIAIPKNPPSKIRS